MDPLELPDDLNQLQAIVDGFYEAYQTATTREHRAMLRHKYRTAAARYNHLAGRGVYMQNVNFEHTIRLIRKEGKKS